MDRSLDEIIAERPQRQSRGQNRGGRNQGRRSNGVKKPYRDERVDLDLDWVHDKYEDDRDTRPSRGSRRPRGDRYSPSPERGAPSASGTRLRIENLHYDITETDLEELFRQIGSISNVSLVYDRAGRSEGVAYVTYARHSDAKTAIAEFDGANAKGQPIRISITSSAPRRGRNPFDNVEKPKGSLFDRVERPGGRDARSLSPTGNRSESAEDGGRRRRGRRGGANYRRSDVSKPAPEHIDRYIPGQRSPARGGGGGGGRRQGGENKESRRGGNPRPKKTQEQLDQEMEDYWGSGAAPGAAEQAEQTAPAPAAAAEEPAAAAPAGDDDIDMIE